LESRNVLCTQIDACQHGKAGRQVATTKDLREMCQNGVTLDDVRRLYGVNATLEDIELMLPSPLIGDLGILPCSEVATESLSENQAESENTEKEEVSPSEDVVEEEVTESLSENQAESENTEAEEMRSSEDVIEEGVNASLDAQKVDLDMLQDIGEEEVNASLDVGEEEVNPSQTEKSKEALSLLSSANQQVAREIEPEEPSFYDSQLYTPLLALCLLSQTSNMLDVLTGLEILLHLTIPPE
jgi:hypothetical protein